MFPHVRNQAKKVGDQHGHVRTSWSKIKVRKEVH